MMKSAFGVTVRPVRRASERSAFINLPWKLYRNDPLWVPPLKASVRALLDVRKHPFYSGGAGAEAEFFLAWEGRDPIGRVAAIENHAFNRFHSGREVHFGFFECVERYDVSRGMMRQRLSWVRLKTGHANGGFQGFPVRSILRQTMNVDFSSKGSPVRRSS